nr:hypothetical protein [Halococcus thailandensis]
MVGHSAEAIAAVSAGWKIPIALTPAWNTATARTLPPVLLYIHVQRIDPARIDTTQSNCWESDQPPWVVTLRNSGRCQPAHATPTIMLETRALYFSWRSGSMNPC